MLIAIECHARGITPTYVAGFRAFLDLNRCVRKGEKAIRILAKRALSRLMRCRALATSVASARWRFRPPARGRAE
jgi:hypothetical protein